MAKKKENKEEQEEQIEPVDIDALLDEKRSNRILKDLDINELVQEKCNLQPVQNQHSAGMPEPVQDFTYSDAPADTEIPEIDLDKILADKYNIPVKETTVSPVIPEIKQSPEPANTPEPAFVNAGMTEADTEPKPEHIPDVVYEPAKKPETVPAQEPSAEIADEQEPATKTEIKPAASVPIIEAPPSAKPTRPAEEAQPQKSIEQQIIQKPVVPIVDTQNIPQKQKEESVKAPVQAPKPVAQIQPQPAETPKPVYEALPKKDTPVVTSQAAKIAEKPEAPKPVEQKPKAPVKTLEESVSKKEPPKKANAPAIDKPKETNDYKKDKVQEYKPSAAVDKPTASVKNEVYSGARTRYTPAETENKPKEESPAIDIQEQNKSISRYDNFVVLKRKFNINQDKNAFLENLLQSIKTEDINSGDIALPEFLGLLLEADPEYNKENQYKLKGLENSLEWR